MLQTLESRIFAGIIGLTVFLLVGGIFWFGNKEANKAPELVVDSQILLGDARNVQSTGEFKATLVEFSDFQCPACAAYKPLIDKLVENNKELRLVYRHFPLPNHQNAPEAAQAAEAAGKQGKFWQMYGKLFDTQKDWAEKSVEPIFEGYAKDIGLDMEKYKKDYGSSEVKDLIAKDELDGARLGVNATPTFYLNGKKLNNPTSLEAFDKLVKEAIAGGVVDASVTEDPNAPVHLHADLAIFVEGKRADLSADKYQSTSEKELSDKAHLHDKKDKILHVHKNGTTVNDFLQSVGMEWSNNCLSVDGKKYCNGGGKSVKLWVNGAKNDKDGAYVVSDLDRILVSFGGENDEELKKQIALVSDLACIYSEKCPERGTPPEEECVGGLGTTCD